MKNVPGKLTILVLILALFMTVFTSTTPTTAADTGFAVPSSCANVPGMNPFNQPMQGRLSDNSYAVETGSENCSVSYYGFGLSIPAGNVVDGIVVTVEASKNALSSDKTLDVSLSYDNGTNWTAIKNTGAMTTTDNTFTLGSAADTWGYSSWTPAIINSDFFRVRLDVNGTDGSVKLDSTQARVYYRDGTTTTVATSGAPSTYGDSVTFTATVTRASGTGTPSGTVDFKNEGVTIGSGVLAGSGGSATATFAMSLLGAGNHSITAEYRGNSTFSGSTSSSITQVVNPRNLTVTADSQSKVYGDSDPTFTCQITSGSLAGTDNFTGAVTRVPGEAVGTYPIQQGTLALSSDYNLTFAEGSLGISPRAITVTADAQSRGYSDYDPALTYQITSGSLAFGDTFSGTPIRVSGMAVGTYAIQQGTLALSSNYDLTFVENTFTIMPPATTLDSIGPKSGQVGETLDIIIDGKYFGEDPQVDFGPGVTVNSVTVGSLTRIVANITIASDASPGSRNVVVTTPSGDAALTDAFSITEESAGGSGSWWGWVVGPLLALGLGILLFFLFFRRRKKETLWEVRARHAYT